MKKYDEYVSNDPKFSDDDRILRVLIKSQHDLGQYNDALEFSNKLMNMNSDMEPDDVDEERSFRDYVWRGFIFTKLYPRRYEDAYKCFHEATKMSPEDNEAYRCWGIALFLDKKYPEAKEKLQK